MEARNIGIALASVAIAIFAAFVFYSLQTDALEREKQKVAQQLTAARSDAAAMEDRKMRTTARLKAIKESYGENAETGKQISGRIESIQAEIKSKEGQRAKAAKELTSVEKQINEAIEFQRAAAVGTTYPQIELSNGKILLNAKLVRFTPQNLEFAHSTGKSSVRWSTLPQEFTDRFHMGAAEGGDTTVIEDTDDTARNKEKLAAAKAEADAQAKISAQRNLLQGRLREVRYSMSTVSASIDGLSRKAAPNPALLAELQRKRAALQTMELELTEDIAKLQ